MRRLFDPSKKQGEDEIDLTPMLDALRRIETRLKKQVSAALTETQSSGLLQLRELQTELFENAVHEWDGSFPIDDDLLELGGGFSQHTAAPLARVPDASGIVTYDGYQAAVALGAHADLRFLGR